MTMDEKPTDLERLARALMRQALENYGHEYQDGEIERYVNVGCGPSWIANVRAVLRELREPSADMVEAGHDIANRMPDGHMLAIGYGVSVRDMFTAMIDKILGDGQTVK